MSSATQWAALMCFCLSVCAASGAEDNALVLHYTFDENPGSTAKDLSSYGNDGETVKAQYLEEYDGRRGVLRFDGKESVLTCPKSKSLWFGGDLSFEMWARFNGPMRDKSGMIFGDRSNFAFYVGYWHTLVFAYYGHNAELRANETMVVPVERRLMSDAWSHVAVVVEYPRLRFYRNGELLRDAYMPFPGVQKRHRQPNRLGAWGDRHAPIDVDELRLYRRALTPAEIAAHAIGREMPPGKDIELAIEPHWYDGTVTVRLSCKGFDFSRHRAEMTLLAGDGKEVVMPKTVPLTEAFDGCGRYIATAAFPLGGLAGKALDGVARIRAPDGRSVKAAYCHASLRKPEWVHTREGHLDGVLPPWTPVKTAKRADGSVEVCVWGRRHVFGATPFLRQIEAAGARLLASPIMLRGRANGEAIAWGSGSVRFRESSDTAASLGQVFDGQRAVLSVDTTMEYDGYMIFDCQIEARRDLDVEGLRLEIPLRTRYATLCFGSNVYPEKRNPQIPMSVFHMGAVERDLAFRFSPNIWLGDEERGLAWQVESDQHWHCADRQKAVEIVPRGDTTTFRANWVDVPTRLAAGESFRYRFALQATPVKPLLRDAWDLRVARCEPFGRALSAPDEGIRGRPAIEFYRESGLRHLFTTECDMWPYPLPAHEPYSRLLHRLNDQLHGAGVRHHNYQIHERFAAMAPEFDLHGLHMSQQPLRTYNPGPDTPPGTLRPGPVGMDYGADSQGTVAYCAKSRALQDACVHALARRLDLYGDDGVYLDGTAVHIKGCRNTLHGCGYRAEDGSIRETYPMFANREFIRRICTVVKQRRPDGIVDVHSWHFNPGGLTYADLLWTGEQWWHRRHKKAEHTPDDLTLDMFRAVFTGRQLGVAAETLAYRLGRSMKVAAISLLHDIPVRPSTPGFDQPSTPTQGRETYFDTMVKLWKMRDRFGATEAEKLPYWRNENYVSISPEGCYATLLSHPTNGVLAFISNLRRDAQTVAVKLNLSRLGLRDQELRTSNPLTNEPVAMARDGKFSVPLGSVEWVYVWVRPSERRRR